MVAARKVMKDRLGDISQQDRSAVRCRFWRRKGVVAGAPAVGSGIGSLPAWCEV